MNRDNNSFAENDARKQLAPYIVNRAGAGLTDFILTLICFVMLFLFSYNVILVHTPYQTYVEETRAVYEKSGLYDENSVAYEYDAARYEEVITRFYSTYDRAVTANKAGEYAKTKQDSGLFDYQDGSYALKPSVDDEAVREFYEKQYQAAISYLDEDPVIRNFATRGMSMMLATIMICFLLSTLIFYLIIPLVTARHVTLGQKFNQLRPVDYQTLEDPSTKQIILRYLAYSLLYYYLPLILMIFIGGGVIVMLGMLIIFNITFKDQRGLQDILSMTMIVDIKQELKG